MDKQQVITAVQELKKNSSQRKFTQVVDLIINLKDIDLKKTEQNVNLFVTLPHSRGKKIKVCALVGPELLPNAKANVDHAVSLDDFGSFQLKKDIRKLAQSYDFFIAQVTIMPKIANVFGKIFGPKGKMPNPKAGCVVPPNANLKPLYDKLQKTVRLQTKNDPVVMVPVGNEKMKEEEIADNVMTVYDTLLHHVPKGVEQIRSVFLKLTMGKALALVGRNAGERKEDSKQDKGPKKDKEPTQDKEPKQDKGSKQDKESKQEKEPNQDREPKQDKELKQDKDSEQDKSPKK